MKVIFINIAYEFLTTGSFFPTRLFEHLKNNLLIYRDLKPLSLLKKKQAVRRIKNSYFKKKVGKNKKRG
ncbi:MAG: hypothetical protein WBH49_08800 [Flavobacteriaceae bacterium]